MEKTGKANKSINLSLHYYVVIGGHQDLTYKKYLNQNVIQVLLLRLVLKEVFPLTVDFHKVGNGGESEGSL